MFRNMVVSLFQHERIETTDAKAKELRRIAEKLITRGKDGSLHARRMAARYVRDGAVLQKLFGEIAGRYSERNGGYTRVMKLGNRKGDNAPISIIELMPAGAPATKQRAAKPEAPVATKESFEAAAPAAEEAVEAPAPAAEEPAVEATPEAEEKTVEAAPAEEEAAAAAEEAPSAEETDSGEDETEKTS